MRSGLMEQVRSMGGAWLAAIAAILLLAGDPAWADGVPAQIQVSGPAGARLFDRQALEALPAAEVRTRTPWHDDVATYRGVTLSSLVAASGNAVAGTVTIGALNDYSVTANIADFIAAGAIVATRMNGAPISVFRKGPFLVVFPWTERKELMNERFFSMAVWYLDNIEIE